MCLWTKWDGTGRARPYLNPLVDNIFFYRQYIARGGYSRCETNQLISNLKKSPVASPAELRYKKSAIKEFAKDLGQILTAINMPTCLTWIPSSRAKSDPLYDDRLEQVAKEVCRVNSFLTAVEICETVTSSTPLHYGGPRNPSVIGNNYRLICHPSFHRVCIIDDVLTTGGSYRAFRNFLDSHLQDIKAIGLFWAITVDDPDDDTLF